MKRGWGLTYYGKKLHWFVDGRSLCGRQGRAYKGAERWTPTWPKCLHCKDILRRKQREYRG